MMKRNSRTEPTKLVQHLRKSDSLLIQTLLWLPSAVKPFLHCLRRPDPESKPVIIRRRNGSNAEKTFYVIRLNFSTYGLASLETFVTAGCAYALKRGWIPVVDLMNQKTMYHEPHEVGSVNVWDVYYEQPFGYSLADVQNAKRVVLGDFCGWRQNMLHFWYFGNPANRKRTQDVYARCIRVNANTRGRIDQTYQSLGLTGHKTLGVVARGTDFVMLKPEMHSIPPAIANVMEEAKKIMRERGWGKLFLATEDLDVLSAFSQSFPDTLVYNDSLRFHAQKDLLIAEYGSDRPKDRYLRGLEYLTTLEILSRCDCLLGMGCSAFNYAPLRRPVREYVKLLSEGTF